MIVRFMCWAIVIWLQRGFNVESQKQTLSTPCNDQWYYRPEYASRDMLLQEYQSLSTDYEYTCDLYAVYDYTLASYAEIRGTTAREIVHEAVHLANTQILQNIDFNDDGVTPDFTFGLAINQEKDVYPGESTTVGQLSFASTNDRQRTMEIRQWFNRTISDFDEWPGCAMILFHRHETAIVKIDEEREVYGMDSVHSANEGCTCDPRANVIDLSMRIGYTNFQKMSLAIQLVHAIALYSNWPIQVPFRLPNGTLVDSCPLSSMGDEKDGYFLFTYRNTIYDGTKPNHLKASKCFTSRFRQFMLTHLRGNAKTSCYLRKCGNGKIEGPHEECDCAYHYHKTIATDCRETDHMCCNSDCQFIPQRSSYSCGTRDDPDCWRGRTCNGTSSVCPTIGFRGRYCGSETNVCADNGRCEASICNYAGMEECECRGVDKLCHEACCKSPQNNRCRPMKDYNVTLQRGHVLRFTKKEGTPCGTRRQGHCDDYGNCILPLCGNHQLDPGEECECFIDDMDACKRDKPCCDIERCMLVPKDQRIICSPANETSECLGRRTCDGIKDTCPSPEGRPCDGGRKLCTKEGQCSDSVCLLAGSGYRECNCTALANVCKLCCELNPNIASANSTVECKSLESLLSEDELAGVRTNKSAETSCGATGKKQGQCDENLGRCRFFFSNSTTCGDGIMDAKNNENCDCGEDEECNRTQPCCNQKNCKFYLPEDNVTCSENDEDNECRRNLTCEGWSPLCPKSEEGRFCTPQVLTGDPHKGVCDADGECTLNLCSHEPELNLEPCFCSELEHQCKVCCRKENVSSTCRPIQEYMSHLTEKRIEGAHCGLVGMRSGLCSAEGTCVFTSSNSTSCGDGRVDARLGEECDCQFEESLCEEIRPCCNHTTCTFVAKEKRKKCFHDQLTDRECVSNLMCNGMDENCPSPEGNLCAGGRKICDYRGRCSGSLCLVLGNDSVPCRCEDQRDACKVCCTFENVQGNCLSMEILLNAEEKSEIILFLENGTECHLPGMRRAKCNDNGVCVYSHSLSTSCGDGDVDESVGEECDCPFDEHVCKVMEPCCDHKTCKFRTRGEQPKCGNYSEVCSRELSCTGTSSRCPDPTGKLCDGGRKACASNGMCTASVCLHVGMEECSCLDLQHSCKVCCQESDRSGKCRPLMHFVPPEERGRLGLFRLSGAPCWDENMNIIGECNETLGTCMTSDAKSVKCGDGKLDVSFGKECECAGDLTECAIRAPCCNHSTCRFVRAEEGVKCWKGQPVGECLQDLVCDGTSDQCPSKLPSTERRLCDWDRKLCSENGTCAESLCKVLATTKLENKKLVPAEKWSECQCRRDKDACKVCCQLEDRRDLCFPLLNLIPMNWEELSRHMRTLKPAGSPCGRMGGRCDGRTGICGETDSRVLPTALGLRKNDASMSPSLPSWFVFLILVSLSALLQCRPKSICGFSFRVK